MASQAAQKLNDTFNPFQVVGKLNEAMSGPNASSDPNDPASKVVSAVKSGLSVADVASRNIYNAAVAKVAAGFSASGIVKSK